jgi:hypothetical protein
MLCDAASPSRMQNTRTKTARISEVFIFEAPTVGGG